MPKVSVILPNFNHAPFLQQRIESILHQTYQDFELIILDDCSTDNSKGIIESYKNNSKISQVIFNSQNGGSACNQWKVGVELAKGEFVWFAESDDWADHQFLEKLVPVLMNSPAIALVYAQSYDVDVEGKIIASRIYWTNNFVENIWNNDFCINGTNFINYLFERNVIPNASACLIRKECIAEVLANEKRIGGLKMCGDWFAWILMANKPGQFIAFVNEHLNYFRVHDQSTRNHHSKERKILRILEEALIFNTGKFGISREAINKKNETLKEKWFQLFSSTKFSFCFFSIGTLIGTGKFTLLREYFNSRKFH